MDDDPQISDLTRTVRVLTKQCGCGCWVWVGSTDSSGYAKVKMRNRTLMTHRYVFEKFIGPLGDMTVDHLCDRHRLCLNPRHFEAVTRTENSVRANHRRWHGGEVDTSECTLTREGEPKDADEQI